MSEKVLDYLSKQKLTIQTPEIAEDFQLLEQDYAKKLWNQLGTNTERFVYKPSFVAEVDLQELYDKFIQNFQHRISALQLVHIIWPVAKYIHSKNPDASFAFLERFTPSVATDPVAKVRLETAKIEIRLHHNSVAPKEKPIDLATIRAILEATQTLVDQLPTITGVHAAFYRVSALYLKEIGDHAAYYREALRYLGCETTANLSIADQRLYATTLGFAALLGKDIYNFGELLTHSVLQSLKGSSEEWLVDVLDAFNHGDLNKFQQLEKSWSQWPELYKSRTELESKLRLLCLMEIGVKRSDTDRHVPFALIASEAMIAPKEVEFLVMKALSRGLIRGTINQVRETVHITWIQPRVLTVDQIEAAASRIDQWRVRVTDIEGLVAAKAKEILVKN